MSWISLAIYLGLVTAWLLYCGLHTFHIGRMPLPRSQALAIKMRLGVRPEVTLVKLGRRDAARQTEGPEGVNQ